MWETLKRIKGYEKGFKDFYELYESYLLPVYRNEKDYWVAFNDFLDEFGITDKGTFVTLSKMQKQFFEENRNLYYGVAETLKKIHNSEIINIIITDNEEGADWVRNNILNKFRINEYINLVVTSKETGVTKPDPMIFEYALRNCNLKKEEVLFIAHDKDEIDGAVGFGLKVIEYNNYLKYETLAKIKIEKFEDIVKIVFR